MIKLDEKYLQMVRDILGRHVSQCEVRLFGSRFRGTSRPYSDIDLALVAVEKLDDIRISNLKVAFAESDLPYRVDVLDWQAISPEFRKVIEETGYEVIQKPNMNGQRHS